MSTASTWILNYLGKEWQNCGACMASNNWNINIFHIDAFCLCHKGVCSDNIKGTHSYELLWIINSSGLESLSSNWYCSINRVGDDVQDGLQKRNMLSASAGITHSTRTLLPYQKRVQRPPYYSLLAQFKYN